LRSHFELERAKNSHLCLGSHPNFSGNPPNTRVVFIRIQKSKIVMTNFKIRE
jgi:hypothetical protein